MQYLLSAGFLATLLVGALIGSIPAVAQGDEEWSRPGTIPGYHPETEWPILIADQNGTVHAFTSQWLGEESLSTKAIVYNQWTIDAGWTMPVDILLSPQKSQAPAL